MEADNGSARLAELVAQADAVELAVQESVREAMLAHKRAGNPVVGWHNGRIEWVAPDHISIEGDWEPSDDQK